MHQALAAVDTRMVVVGYYFLQIISAGYFEVVNLLLGAGLNAIAAINAFGRVKI